MTDETPDKPLKNRPCDACDTSEGGASGDNYEAEEREAIQNEPEVDLLDIPEFLRRNDHQTERDGS